MFSTYLNCWIIVVRGNSLCYTFLREGKKRDWQSMGNVLSNTDRAFIPSYTIHFPILHNISLIHIWLAAVYIRTKHQDRGNSTINCERLNGRLNNFMSSFNVFVLYKNLNELSIKQGLHHDIIIACVLLSNDDIMFCSRYEIFSCSPCLFAYIIKIHLCVNLMYHVIFYRSLWSWILVDRALREFVCWYSGH